MPIIQRSELEVALEHQAEIEEREIALAAETRRNEHAYRVAKLKHQTQPRYKSIERAVVTITKAPALAVALICITVLVLRGKEVPESLNNFIAI